MSIDQVAQETRISPRFLEALEAEQFHELPAPVYVRGFLRSYANYLHLEAQPLLDRLIGGDMSVPGADAGYVRGNARNGHSNGKSAGRRNDPFQKAGVMAATPPVARSRATPHPPAAIPIEEDAWAPEEPAPFTPAHVDHGYIPGSDLMEAPEYVEEFEPEAEPVFQRRRTAGVLAERPPMAGEPGVPRRVLVFGGAVVAILGFLALAVLVTRDGGNGNNAANAGDNPQGGATPGTIIPVGGAVGTATAEAAAGTSVSPSVTANGSVSPSASTTASVTTTPGATQTPASGTATATASPTTAAQPTATPVPPTATPVPPTPTPVPQVFAENRAFGECTPTDGSYNCGPGPFRVVCYPPFGFPQNRNWWVDVDRSFFPLPAGWREYDGLLDNGDIINAGQSLCASQ